MKCRGYRRYLIAAAFLPAFAGSPAMAKLPPIPQRAADLYLQELARVQRSKGRVNMEPLFVRADSLDDAFFPPLGDYSQQGQADYLTRSIEGTSEAEVDSLQEALHGVHIVVSDYVFTYLDTKFFLDLAEAHGLPTDVEFLKVYAGRYLGSESVQDCVHFGKDLMVDQYGAWVNYRTRHPTNYARYTAEEAQNVIEQLMGTCACGDSSTVDLELDHFLRRFPNDPAASVVRTRLTSIRKGTSGVDFNCSPPYSYR